MSDHEDELSSAAATTTQPDPPCFWSDTEVPDIDSESFQGFIHRHPEDIDRHDAKSYSTGDQISSWPDAPNQESHTTFGDDGVTASVNAYGDLMQFSRYLGCGRSGVFCVDHSNKSSDPSSSTSEPYLVDARAEALEELSRDRHRQRITYGLQIPFIRLQDCRHSGYVHDRWPRYEFGREDESLQLTMQWMVREKTVLQQCNLTNNGNDDISVPINFKSSMHIRDLDYLDSSYQFNDHWEGHVSAAGPNGYGWVLVHPLPHEPKDPNQRRPSQNSRIPSEMNQAMEEVETEIGEGASAPPVQPDAIAVVVSVFVNGKAVPWPAGQANASFTELTTQRLESKSSVEVVTAYKMIHMEKSKADWKDFLIPPVVADVNKHLKTSSGSFKAFHLSDYEAPHKDAERSTLSGIGSRFMASASIATAKTPKGLPTENPVNHIDFVIRRNLEHILSVCAIPVHDSLEEKDVQPIALTCGNMSGHRVCSSASFFAFSFLIEIIKRLDIADQSVPKGHFKFLRDRIDAVCRGHLMWLSKKVHKTEGRYFAANYWTTGEIMPHSSASFMPVESITDTPFQVLKASLFASQNDQNLARGIIQDVAEDWILHLDKTDKREARAWPHSEDEGCNKFRLNEHVWVWRALKLIEEDRLKPSDTERSEKLKGKPTESSGDYDNSAEDQKDRYQVQGKPKTNDKPFTKFDSREVQRKILQRFTVENDVSKKRMLAMTRSPRETRFLFHASDTALFYGIEWDFFLKETPFKEVWENTIKAQIHHSENSETVWDNSIRYALAIMMGTRGISINTRLPHELVRSSLDVLFRATSPNGLFNGRLDEITKEPALFSGEMDRDFYFRATFEIPYIFLTHGRGIQLRLKIKSEKSSSLPEPNEMRAAPHSSLDEVVNMMTAQPKRHSASTGMDGDPWSPTHSNTLNLQGQSESLQEKKTTKTLTMKKSMPFNSLVDQSSIVELDEEWLYNYPPFFTDRELTDVDLKEEVGRIIEPTEGDASGAVVTRAAHAYIAKYDALTADENVPLPEASFNLLESINPDPYFNAKWAGVKSPLGPPPWASHGTRVWIADVLEQKSFSKQQGAENVEFFEVSNNLDLWKKLASPRTSIKAKKRFIWLPDADHEMALVCCLTSPSPEKAAVSLFFDRHAHYENFFSEKTTMIYNTWESELHLSFYRLVDESYQTTKEQIPESSIFPLSSNEVRKLHVARASVGFRFFGDFFDQHWTCHFIEHIPGVRAPWNDVPSRILEKRKVLELHLLNRILEEVIRSTREVSGKIREDVGLKHDISFLVLDSDDCFSWSRQGPRFHSILRVVEEDISDVLLIISKWSTREKDRGQERPRWSRDDEQKYRRVINELEGTTSLRIRVLQKDLGNIQLLREKLKTSQEQLRDDIGFYGAENIRFFTYVTAVFLPLGFAASIFSMSEEPPEGVLRPMVICSVIALVLTFVALANAKRLNAIVKEVSMFVTRYSLSKMSTSPLMAGHRRRKREQRDRRIQHAEEAKVENPSGSNRPGSPSLASRVTKARDEQISWWFWFWLAYFFIEFPARRVLVAYRSLSKKEVTKWTTYVHVIIGVLILPVFIVSFIFQLLVYNVVDFVKYLWETLMQYMESHDPNETKNFERHLNWLTYPMDPKCRPFKGKLQELKKSKDEASSKAHSKQISAEHQSGVDGTSESNQN